MLSRDFVNAFLTGQVATGLSEAQAKDNFVSWVMSNSSIQNDEKEKVISDLGSYTVKG